MDDLYFTGRELNILFIYLFTFHLVGGHGTESQNTDAPV